MMYEIYYYIMSPSENFLKVALPQGPVIYRCVVL